MKKKRVILSAGGTGGHLFPAQVVATELQEECELLFVAGGLSKSPYFARKSLPFIDIPTATLTLKKPFASLRGVVKIVQGIRESEKILKEFVPDLVVGFGSFYTFPLLVAAARMEIPLVLHEQNAVPGKVNRLFSAIAKKVAYTFPYSARFLKGDKEEVLFPLRYDFSGAATPADWESYSLTPGLPTLLIFGGSQGASFLNHVVKRALPGLTSPYQVLHIVGKYEEMEEVRGFYEKERIPACVKEFEWEMERAYRIATCAIGRAGAGTIAELLASKTPAIVIPFPYASEGHQSKNGAYFAEEVGGGILLAQERCTPEALRLAIEELLERAPSCREAMEQYHARHVVRKLSTVILDSK